MSALTINSTNIPYISREESLQELSQVSKQPVQKTLSEKICDFVCSIFEAIKLVVLFPFRYLGSKTWSIPGVLIRLPIVLLFGWTRSESFAEQLFGKGYQFSPQEISSEQTKPYLRNACIASSIAASTGEQGSRRMEKDWLDPFELLIVPPNSFDLDLEALPGNIEIIEKGFLDRKTGLKMMIVEDGEETIITFGAAGGAKVEFTNPDNNPEWVSLEKQIWGGVVWPTLYGLVPDLYEQAEALYLAVKDHPSLQGKKLTLVGHCLGGSLASYIGIKHQVQVNGFNTLPFGGGIQQVLGDAKLREAGQFVTHLSIGNDFFSDCPGTTVLDTIVNLIGFRTPGNFGKHYVIPAYPDYNSPADGNSFSKVNQNRIHNYFVGSMMAYCGFSNRDKPSSLLHKGAVLDELSPTIVFDGIPIH